MSFLDLAKKRYSVRRYKSTPVEREKLLKIIEAGRIAPSACNLQPWHFIVVDDEEIRAQLSLVYSRDWIKKAPAIIVICGDHQAAWKRSDGKDHCDVDAAIAIDHMTLAAADEGLGTCWICAFDAEKCKRIFNLPEHIEPIALLPVGYPDGAGDENRHDTARKKLDEIVSWNQFGS